MALEKIRNPNTPPWRGTNHKIECPNYPNGQNNSIKAVPKIDQGGHH
ncbi:hypothetical protein D1AOALGA4SA_9950 [Olavius algarvensis Delta 1 endosymbiont]|nr:hypothetical protein D1AOALGA4SA_9950 [Olavius algarvensis Delta 1 endosymbiont]